MKLQCNSHFQTKRHNFFILFFENTCCPTIASCVHVHKKALAIISITNFGLSILIFLWTYNNSIDYTRVFYYVVKKKSWGGFIDEFVYNLHGVFLMD